MRFGGDDFDDDGRNNNNNNNNDHHHHHRVRQFSHVEGNYATSVKSLAVDPSRETVGR